MWNTTLCLSTDSLCDRPNAERIRLIHEAGFDGFFIDWEPGMDVPPLRRLADELGMMFQSIHAPFTKADAMWYPDERTEAAVSELIDCLRICAENRVPIMVAHAFIGFDRHEPTQVGIDNYARAVREAERLGVTLALENTEGEEYLEALMRAFEGNPAVGFCWDTGHDLCYNHGQDMTKKYGSRLCGTHLDDNLGILDHNGKTTPRDDLHLLPFDGIADWEYNMRRLAECGFQGPLTLELNTHSKLGRHENDKYSSIPIERYLAEAYARACRLAALRARF